MNSVAEFTKYLSRKKIIEEQLSYADIQYLWLLLDACYRFKLVKAPIFYDLEEEFKWETMERGYQEYEEIHGEFRDGDYYLYEYCEDDIYPPLKDKGKIKGQTRPGKPHYARPGTSKGNKRK